MWFASSYSVTKSRTKSERVTGLQATKHVRTSCVRFERAATMLQRSAVRDRTRNRLERRNYNAACISRPILSNVYYYLLLIIYSLEEKISTMQLSIYTYCSVCVCVCVYYIILLLLLLCLSHQKKKQSRAAPRRIRTRVRIIGVRSQYNNIKTNMLVPIYIYLHNIIYNA